MIDKDSKVVIVKCKSCGKEIRFKDSWRGNDLKCACGGKDFIQIDLIKEVITK